MGSIGHRDCGTSVSDLARTPYDVAIVGGGIYGAMLHLEAARLGWRSVLVECGDFGGATSENSLRIVHGGLRYLKTLNVARSVESTRERQWYAASLPRLVTTLPCLLPIYERGGKRASVLQLGLAANDLLGASLRYLDGTPLDVPRGYLVGARDARALAPSIPGDGLSGGAVWHDLQLRCPGRVVVEALRWAADLGGVAVNYVEAVGLLQWGGGVRGIAVADTATGASAELEARVVINAAGPWAGELATRWGAADASLAPLVVAWNLLLDRAALSNHAVALQDPIAPKRAMLFATSLGGRLLLGTGYAPLGGRACAAAEAVAEAALDGFLATVNRCMPGLDATRRDIVRLYSGVLPAAAAGSSEPRSRNVISTRGPRGLFTISSTKFTTARSAARRALSAVCRTGLLSQTAAPRPYPRCHAGIDDGLFGSEWTTRDLERRLPALERIVRQEAVEHLDDLVLRRTTLADQPARALSCARALCALHERWRKDSEHECSRLAARLKWRHAAWAMNQPGREPAAVARSA